MGKPLRLLPTIGKYSHISYAGNVYEVWAQSPYDGLPGTLFDRETALKILKMTPSVATLLPQIENGKTIRQLDDNEIEEIKIAQQSNTSLLKNFAVEEAPQVPASDSHLASLVAQQSSQITELLKTLNQQSEVAKAQEAKIDELKETVSKLQGQATQASKSTEAKPAEVKSEDKSKK